MILEVVQSKWSLTWYDPLGPRMCVLELMNGHVLQTLREQLKVPGSRLEGSELLTSEFLRFRSRLNETSGRQGRGLNPGPHGWQSQILLTVPCKCKTSQGKIPSIPKIRVKVHIEIRIMFIIHLRLCQPSDSHCIHNTPSLNFNKS